MHLEQNEIQHLVKTMLPSNTGAISTSPSRWNYLRNAHLVSFSLIKIKFILG